eukprot:m.62974 g.62974  ORF g.62974 m.62974 type:complete len:126 (+) comp9639_c0_seq1:122-499(+)
MTRYTNLHRRNECKEGATSWARLRAQAGEPAPDTTGTAHAAAAPAAPPVGGEWPTSSDIGRKKQSTKVQLDTYRKNQSADALDSSDVPAPGDAPAEPAPTTTTAKKKKTGPVAGKKKKAKKIVTF